MITVREALKSAEAKLASSGVPDAAGDARRLLAEILSASPLQLFLQTERELTGEEQARLNVCVNRRAAREPLQWILGSTGFMGLDFEVNAHVLVPRPDTEILVEEAMRRIPRGARVLDLGTGSGCIAVSLAVLRPDLQVSAVDLSGEALRVAQRNAGANGARVRFLQGDWFEPVAGESFEAILSNPPYIARAEQPDLMPEVQQEPELALFADHDGLACYEKIVKEAPVHLEKDGLLLFEIGYRQKDAVCALLRERIGEPFALRDYGGQWRVVGACHTIG